MKVVLDTNVVISGIFFSGPPAQILDAWRNGDLQIALSAEILSEYQRVARILSKKYKVVNVQEILNLLALNAEITDTANFQVRISADPDDDKFIACALASGSGVVVSGDKHLLEITDLQEIKILSPRDFLNTHLA